jgi:integrase
MSVRTRRWGDGKTAYLVTYSTSERDARGKRVRRFRTFDRKRDAEAFDAEVHVDVAAGKHVPASKSVTVADAGELWLASCKADELERASIDSYDNHFRLHMLPYLGETKLSALSVPIVRNWQKKLREAGRSADMVSRVTRSLGTMLADCQENGLVATNVVRSLRRRKKIEGERRQTRKLVVGVDIPKPAEIDRILGAATGRWRPFLLVAIRCGLRSSELRGLMWEDIDFAKAVLHVRRKADRYNVIGFTKSEAGERSLPIPPATLSALREWKVACPRLDKKLCYVFPNGAGNIESHSNLVNRGLIPIVTKALGTAKYSGLHALRHYHTSWLANPEPVGCGLPIAIASKRLGHSSIAITVNLYLHLFPTDTDSAKLAAAEGKHG